MIFLSILSNDAPNLPEILSYWSAGNFIESTKNSQSFRVDRYWKVHWMGAVLPLLWIITLAVNKDGADSASNTCFLEL